MKIGVSREIEAGLAGRAAGGRVGVSEYVAWLEQVSPLSTAERAAAWRQAATGLPRTPPLSDEAISRESIYCDRG